MSRDQNAGQSYNTKIGNNSFERVEEFKYLGTTLTDQNSIQEEIQSRYKSGNTCYHLVQNRLSSSLLSEKYKDEPFKRRIKSHLPFLALLGAHHILHISRIMVKIYRTIILPFVLYGYETWSFTLRVEHRLRVFENRVLRRI